MPVLWPLAPRSLDEPVRGLTSHQLRYYHATFVELGQWQQLRSGTHLRAKKSRSYEIPPNTVNDSQYGGHVGLFTFFVFALARFMPCVFQALRRNSTSAMSGCERVVSAIHHKFGITTFGIESSHRLASVSPRHQQFLNTPGMLPWVCTSEKYTSEKGGM
eukprot:427600-Amphidinium_carterae.1